MPVDNEDSIKEKPSTHNKKAQQAVFVLIILVLIGMSISSFLRMNSGTKITEDTEDRLSTSSSPQKQQKVDFEERYRSAINKKNRRSVEATGESYEELVARLKRELFDMQNKGKNNSSFVPFNKKRSLSETWANKELDTVRKARYDDSPIDLGFNNLKSKLPVISSLNNDEDGLNSHQRFIQAEIERTKVKLAKIKGGQPYNEISSSSSFDFDKEHQVGQTSSKSPNSQPLPGQKTLPIGTVIRASIDQKVISDYFGPLRLQITHDVYDLERKYILIPAGSICIAKSIRISNINEPIQARVGYLVNDLRLPNGNIIDFSRQAALDREGVAAVEGDVNRHLLAQFLGVAAYALISNSSSFEGTGLDRESYRGQVSEGVRDQASPIAQKYLNLIPTITLESGTPVRIFIEEPVYVYPWSSIANNYDVS